MHGEASRARARGDMLNDPPLPRIHTAFCAWSRRASDAFQLRKVPKNPPHVVQKRVDRPFFSMETARDPLFTPKNPVRTNQQPAKSGLNPVCGAARRAAPVRRNDRAGRSIASGARPSLYRDGGNAARQRGGWVHPPPRGGVRAHPIVTARRFWPVPSSLWWRPSSTGIRSLG